MMARRAMHIEVLTLFPTMFAPVLGASLLKRAQDAGRLTFTVRDLRDYTHDARRTVDDRPYGGGPGMIMKPEPIFEAIEDITARGSRAGRGRQAPHTVLLCAQGERLTMTLAKELARHSWLLLICGHYEGVDERVKTIVDRSISIGDYVLTGGELPAMVLIDTIARYVPGVIGHAKATEEESFVNGLLEYPHYTRPPVFRGMAVPEVLLTGDHPRIAQWRKRQSVSRTNAWRPDLASRHAGARRRLVATGKKP